MNVTAIDIITKYRRAYKDALYSEDTNAVFLWYLYNTICSIAKGRKIETDMELKTEIIKKLFEIKKDIQLNLQIAIDEKDDFMVSCMKQNIITMEML